tara:strand:- start:2352 stop:3089 length:738 start_codon:yes stop_codon:yes gene_type:complete
MNRNQFTFYKSFDDTFEFLNDKQTLIYLKMLRDVQFLRLRIQDVIFEDKLLNGIWQSTKHTFETSIKGYLDSQLNTKISNPFFGCYENHSKKINPFETPKAPPSEGVDLQVKGKEQNKDKDKSKEEKKLIDESDVNNSKLLKVLNSATDRKFRVVDDKAASQIYSRIKDGFTYKDIQTAIINASSSEQHKESAFKYLTLEYISRGDQTDKWIQFKGDEGKKPKKGNSLYNPEGNPYEGHNGLEDK